MNGEMILNSIKAELDAKKAALTEKFKNFEPLANFLSLPIEKTSYQGKDYVKIGQYEIEEKLGRFSIQFDGFQYSREGKDFNSERYRYTNFTEEEVFRILISESHGVSLIQYSRSALPNKGPT